MMFIRLQQALLGLIALFLCLTCLPAAELPGQQMQTPVRPELLDRTVFAEWDREQAQPPRSEDAQRGPGWILWTTGTRPGHSGLKFGESRQPGPRHLRIGLTRAIPVGSVLTRGNVRVSLLREQAEYPGELAAEDHWLPVQGLVAGRIAGHQAAEDEYALWVFPPGTATRALRFTHEARRADASYHGWLGGAMVLKDRLLNLAPQGVAATSASGQKAVLLNNGLRDGWDTWQNLDERDALLEQRPVISPEHPEPILLSWSAEVELSGLLALWTGFGSVEIQAWRGPASRHPRDASDNDWETIQSYSGFESGYPATLWPNEFRFPQPVRAKAVRLRITGVTPAGHPHVERRPAGGKRVWLGELMALTNLRDENLDSVPVARVEILSAQPPIGIPFQLPEAGYVTLVIEDAHGRRVRNLVSETWFPAGDNVAYWDSSHDLDRDLDAAEHGLYNIPARLVEPGQYRVRGLWRKELQASYEFSTYNSGNPPWSTPDHTGGWLANHSPPSAAVFVPAAQSPTGKPAVLLGSFVTEGPDGLAWVDLDGTKHGGLKWIGGNWTAAPHLGRNMQPDSPSRTAAYVASVWETEKNSGLLELRITALETGRGRQLIPQPVLVQPLPEEPAAAKTDKLAAIGGITAYGDTVVCALRYSNRLLLIDAGTGKQRQELPLPSPRGITFDPAGRLWVLSGTEVVRFDSLGQQGQAAKPRTIVSKGLEDPWGLTLDNTGQLYVSDHGSSHQVKVFSPDGKLLRKIGHPGPPKAGLYDPLQMLHPAGLAIDSRNQLWVTEHDYLPKRVSVWSLDGKLIRAIYGPAKYGGGGVLDPQDSNRFYYADEERGTLEFQLDWQQGTSRLTHVLYRSTPETLQLPFRSAAPETAIYHQGRRYFTNGYNSSPTNGPNSAFLFVEREGALQPAVGLGLANEWELLKTEPFRSLWPEGADPNGDRWRDNGRNQALYLWVDGNEDARVQPVEVQMLHTPAQGITVQHDLSFTVARAGERALRFRPRNWSPAGIPGYDLKAGEVLTTGVQAPASSGGAQLLADDSPEAVITLGVKPFHSYSLCGLKDGQPVWSYPNPWPGLHASHHAAKPTGPGQLIGATRLMGGFIQPRGSQVGPLFALNANMGNFYLFTRDGLFVATVFTDSRLGTAWKMAVAQRGMNLDGLTLHDENFWPSINQAADGKIYVVDGSHTCLLRLDGLETLRPIPSRPLVVTAEHLQQARVYVEEQEAARQQALGSGVLRARLLKTGPRIDGQFNDWSAASWVEIDRRGDGANFNSNAKPYQVLAALAADATTLYAAWDTQDKSLLKNSGESPQALFKTGGGLDLMLGTNPAADPARRDPVAGDLRLLITLVDGKPRALLYRPVVPGTAPTDKVVFTSPVGTVAFDQVRDISDQVQLAFDQAGRFELSVPLKTLGLTLSPGLTLRGDIGILRGQGFQTTARSYWSNKATAITADVPSEARLSPRLWGRIEWTE